MDSSTSFLVFIVASILFLYSSTVPWLVRNERYPTIIGSVAVIFMGLISVYLAIKVPENQLIAAWIFTGAIILGYIYDIFMSYLFRRN